MIYPPYANELLSSWLIRNSIMHGSDPMGWIYGFWGEWRAWTRDIDRYLPKVKTIELARFSRMNIEDIEKMTLTPIVNRIEGDTPDINRAWSWIIPTGRRNRSVVSGLQYCPKCLNEKQTFFPRYWRISWHTQCSKHEIQLMDRCCKCSMPFSPHLINFDIPKIYLCTRCGYDLRKVKSISSPKRVLDIQNLLDKILYKPSEIRKNYSQWRIQASDNFFLFARDMLVLLSIISRKESRYINWQLFLFGKLKFNKLSVKSGQTFDMRTIDERASMLYIISNLLSNEPSYFIKSLNHVHFTQAIMREKNFPKSKLMCHLLLTLPPSSAFQYKRVNTKFMSQEPRSVSEVEDIMESIRKFL